MNSSTKVEKTPDMENECICRVAHDFDALRHSPVFAGLPIEVIKLFAYLSDRTIYQPGEYILQKDQQADRAFFLICGDVDITAVHKGEEIVMQKLQSGAFFGELALLAKFNWFFNARTTTKTEIISVSRKSFQKVLATFPDQERTMIERIVQVRVTRLTEQTEFMLDKLVENGASPEGRSAATMI